MADFLAGRGWVQAVEVAEVVKSTPRPEGRAPLAPEAGGNRRGSDGIVVVRVSAGFGRGRARHDGAQAAEPKTSATRRHRALRSAHGFVFRAPRSGLQLSFGFRSGSNGVDPCSSPSEDAAAAFSDYSLCERNYWRLKDDEMLRYGWERFRDLVKHRTRYLFFDTVPEETPWDEGIPPSRMLSALGTLVNDFEMFSVISRYSIIFRVRIHPESESFCTAADLGPPPKEETRANRMRLIRDVRGWLGHVSPCAFVWRM